MWVHDIVSIITALSTEQRRLPIGLVGTGRLGKAALFAAALDSRIAAVRVRLPSLSYRDEAEQGLLADIPRILATLDLPEVAKLVLPRGCWLEFAAPTGRANPIRIWACPHSERIVSRGTRECSRLECGSELVFRSPEGKWPPKPKIATTQTRIRVTDCTCSAESDWWAIYARPSENRMCVARSRQATALRNGMHHLDHCDMTSWIRFPNLETHSHAGTPRESCRLSELAYQY